MPWKRFAELGVLIALTTSQAIPAANDDDFPPSLVSWTADPVHPVVFTGAGGDAWDRKIRERGWITVEDGKYHLWYTGYNDDRSPTRMLGHATSLDGITWTRDPANPLHSASWVEDMCVVKDGGVDFMFAEGKGDIAHLLTSEDRVHWVERGALDIRKVNGSSIEPGPFGTPTVFVENGIWSLFYERGDQGVWLARSNDRKIWTNVQDGPVLEMGPDRYDSTAVAINQVIKRGETYYAFYHANANKPWKDWTTCLAKSSDMIHWSKYAGNPLVQNNSSSGIVVDASDGIRLYTMHPEVRLFRARKGD